MYNILINKSNNLITVVVVKDGEVVEIYEENQQEKRLEGDIYLGKVKNIISGMESAFIDIGENKNSLIHIKDLLPKESNITGNIYKDTSKIDISKIIKSGDEILVQVKRDCNEQKGPRVTKDIKINGNLVILMPFCNFVTVSQKIEDKIEKERLKNIVEKLLPKNYGAIIRTVAENRQEAEIEEEITKLIHIWNEIEKKASKQKNIAPIKIFDNGGIIGKIITDLSQNNLEKIYINDISILKQYSNIKDKIEVIPNCLEMFDANKINLNRKIWLKCGGFITIDKTEALTAIDVNSGKFTGKNELEKTVLKVNLEASKEIAKQIRLRDMGGIIIIDYIDMENEEDRQYVRKYIIECLKNDRSKVQVMEFTKLGLLEITRKHILGRE